MRVTQSLMFNDQVRMMNDRLSDLMESNMQASSQKKVNKPSDDPVGMARILGYRASINEIEQYRENIQTAKGWLGLADDTLLEVSNLLIRAKELAEQASTGTLDADNREEISYEVRQLFEQMIALSNTEFEGKSIFAGQKVANNAYEQSLWLMSSDSSLDGTTWSVSGSSDKTALVQFFDASNPDGGTNLNISDANLRYRYSTDGGDTFTTGTPQLVAGSYELDLGGATATLDATTTVATSSSTDTMDNSGTWMWLRPTAEYKGDDEDVVDVNEMGQSAVQGFASGSFSRNIAVRIDNAVADLAQQVEYSYSRDGGQTWVTGNVASNGSSADSLRLIVPGGTLMLASNGGNSLAAGNQFLIQPRTAAIDIEISFSEKIQLNSVGKDVFGGIYQDPNGTTKSLSDPNHPEENVFDVFGRLVAYMETNNQQGIQEVLADLDDAQHNVMNQVASIAGRENRLDVADNVLSGLKFNEEQRKSAIEDVDVTELMTKLSQQQIAYEAVLKSSSTIMKMSLVNHI